MSGPRPGVRRAGAVLALLTAVLGPLLLAPPASAHPLGNFTVNRYTGLLVSPDRVEVDHVVDLAEIPTAQLGDRLDDLDRLAEEECASDAAALDLRVAGARVALVVQGASAVTAPGEADLPVTRLTCRFVADAPVTDGLADDATVDVELSDASAPGALGWREVTAVGDRTTLVSSDVPASSTSERLSAYPDDLLASPLAVTSARLVVAPGGPAASLPGDDVTAPAGVEEPDGWLARQAAGLVDAAGPLAAVGALLLAALLGSAHALAPGHGKSVMAFWMIQRGVVLDGADASERRAGSRAALRAALSVGGAVTLAHTGSVLALGLLVTAGSTVVPADVYPWLTLLSGALIVALGLWLLRRAADATEGHGHGHGHGHGQGHGHGHGGTATLTEPTTSTTGRVELAPRERRLSTTAMGLVGGLVPSPSALLLLLGAVAIGRPWFGVLLVVAFGAGMATSLAVVGLTARGLVVRAEAWLASRGGRAAGVRALLPYAAAAGVAAVGLVVCLRAVADLL